MKEMYDMASLVKSIVNRYGISFDVRTRILTTYGVVYIGMNKYHCVNKKSKWFGTTVKLIRKDV